MKRIAGILNLDKSLVEPAELERMLQGMWVGSQDEVRVWSEGEIGFACILVGNGLPLQNDKGPGRTSHQGWTIVFDGRLDNRQELLSILRSHDQAGDLRISDEELVLAAYEKWQLSCPRHLIGDFAFAIWDQKKHRLVCARDHFGVKPLYYSLYKGSFVFASTPIALFASGKVRPVLQEERIADFLVNSLEGIDKTSTFYSDVYRHPPAHTIIVQEGRAILERYWELQPTLQYSSMTEADYVEAFEELFSEAVRSRLQDVPASGSMLSGGMDSSAIVATGRKLLANGGRDQLHTFTVIPNCVSGNRETSSIDSVLNQGDLQSHLISETGLLRSMDELVHAIETELEPFDCLMNLSRAVYLHARDHQLLGILDGIDGDGLLSRTGHLAQLWQQRAYRIIVEETLNADGPTAEYKKGRRLLVDSLLSTIMPFAPAWLRKMRQPWRSFRVFEASIRDSIIDRQFAVWSGLGDRFATLDSHSPRIHSRRQMDFHRVLLDHPHLTVGLERYERVASAFGIEARHPFTDIRLAEFCLALPWQLKSRRGWTKLILRRAMEPYLPSEVVWRKDKDSLMWEVNRLILKSRAEYFHQATLDERELLKPYVDIRKLEMFWREYLGEGDEKHAELIWSGIALALWLRRHRNMQAALR